MSMSEYFTIHQSIVDRDDLTLHEKMCCVVLARFAGRDEFEDKLSKDIIAIKMGCSNEEAYRAIEGLVSKGVLEYKETKIEIGELDQKKSKIVKKGFENRITEIEFSDMTEQSKKPRENLGHVSIESKLEVLREIIEEVVSDKALRIILNIAEGDIELIKMKYQVAKASQYNDVVEVLMHELQRKRPVINSVQLDINQESQEVATQINQKRIAELYKLSKKS